MFSLDKLLSFKAIAFVLLLASTPVFLSAGPVVERTIAPVVSEAVITDIRPDPKTGNFLFDMSFDKNRECEYLGISWYYKQGQTVIPILPPKYDPEVEQTRHGTRPTSKDIYIRGWRSPINDLRGVVAYVHHRCHALWATQTKFYEHKED